ncbi:MAG TPA: DUF4397 domain-containing protein [Chitinophagaceae bacterium]|nr:DUF4397 domain-containing protein [Chitinophagaceae bacterium]
MKKVSLSFRRNLFAGIAIVAAAVLFAACTKNNDNNVDVPAAGLMAVNLAPDQRSVVVTLSGNLLTRTPLSYTSYTGGYQNIYIGNRPVQSFDYPASKPLASVDYEFKDDKYYSVFVVGANNSYRNVVVQDNIDSLSAASGQAYIRYVNAITDSVNTPLVTISAGGNTVVNETATYAGVSEFKAVAPGQLTVAAKNGAAIDASRTIDVAQGRVYTILLSGVPGATDDTKVQIRFIQNGTLTDDGK